MAHTFTLRESGPLSVLQGLGFVVFRWHQPQGLAVLRDALEVLPTQSSSSLLGGSSPVPPWQSGPITPIGTLTPVLAFGSEARGAQSGQWQSLLVQWNG